MGEVEAGLGLVGAVSDLLVYSERACIEPSCKHGLSEMRPGERFLSKEFSNLGFGPWSLPVYVGGVDFSAAMGERNATWFCGGLLERSEDGGVRNNREYLTDPVGPYLLRVSSLANCGADGLIDFVRNSRIFLTKPTPPITQHPNPQSQQPIHPITTYPTIIGFDFPFAYPLSFTNFFTSQFDNAKKSHFSNWLTASRLIASTPFSQIEKARAAFNAEPRTLSGNLTDPKAQSPLHRINPGMLKMTWRGLQILTELKDSLGFSIAPFDFDLGFSPKTTDAPTPSAPNPNPNPNTTPNTTPNPIALEIYPAAALKALGLSHQKYKGRSPEARAVRDQNLQGLQKLHTVKSTTINLPRLKISPEHANSALLDDNAFDALVAAYATAAVILNLDAVRHPTAADLEIVSREGWIYVPPRV